MIYETLNEAIKRGASDIHITNKLPPILRVSGTLVKLEELGICNPKTIKEELEKLANPAQMERFEKEKALDFSFKHGESRYRAHFFQQKGSYAAVFRLIPTKIPRITDLNLPASIPKFTTLKSGLVLVTGVTGSGKSTTLASIINEINMTQSKHIITIEDPVEFVHEHHKCIVNQREVGQDVDTFANAVKGAMREDPDILLLGEMRDLDTIQNAITMAETGHLVFGTLHSKSAAETVDRIIDVFPGDQQAQIKVQLAGSLKGVITQALAPKIGGGRAPIVEVMVVNDAIRAMIREGANANNINDSMMSGSKLGSQTIYQSVAQLCKKGLISMETAEKYVEDIKLLKSFL